MLDWHSTNWAMSFWKDRDCMQFFSDNESHGSRLAYMAIHGAILETPDLLIFTVILWDQWRTTPWSLIYRQGQLHSFNSLPLMNSSHPSREWRSPEQRPGSDAHMRIHDASEKHWSRGKGIVRKVWTLINKWNLNNTGWSTQNKMRGKESLNFC